jgi:hypothetical protein
MSQPAAKLAAPEPFRCSETKDATMNTTLDLFADTLPAVHEAQGTDRTAFELGWDYAHYRLTPPPEALADGHPVRQGWQAGSAVFGNRTLKPTSPVRKWLQLRFSAWRRGRVFEGTQVTPNFLAQIDVPLCPITRRPLTHASGAGSDASVDRVCNAAGYAAGNLAVMSARANEAKADLSCRDALTVVQRLEASGLDTLDGLNTLHWSRLAVLMSFATLMKHDEAACLPLLVLPPNRLRLLNPVQALQAVVTLAFTEAQAVPRLRELMAHLPAPSRHDFQVFVLTLQARRLAIGMTTEGADLRHALEDLWTDAAVNRRWQRFALQLDEAACERAVRMASKLRLGGRSWQWLPQSTATDGWALQDSALPQPPVKHIVQRA